MKLTIIFNNEFYTISLDFDYNFTLSGLIPYIQNILKLNKDSIDKMIILDNEKEILSPNCRIVELMIINPSKFKTLTISCDSMGETYPKKFEGGAYNNKNNHKFEYNKENRDKIIINYLSTIT